LMMIVEELLLEPMYVLPSQKRPTKELLITREMVDKRGSIFESLTGVDDVAA